MNHHQQIEAAVIVYHLTVFNLCRQRDPEEELLRPGGSADGMGLVGWSSFPLCSDAHLTRWPACKCLRALHGDSVRPAGRRSTMCCCRAASEQGPGMRREEEGRHRALVCGQLRGSRRARWRWAQLDGAVGAGPLPSGTDRAGRCFGDPGDTVGGRRLRGTSCSRGCGCGRRRLYAVSA